MRFEGSGAEILAEALIAAGAEVVFGADAYARRGGRLGVVEVSSGGGATFAVGGLGESFAASVPLLLVSSDIQRDSRGTGALTETDQLALFRAVTKWQAVAG